MTTLVHGHRSAPSGLELLAALTSRDLRLRYQGSLLGWAWPLIRPFALGLVLTFALGKVLGTGITAVFLLTGLFPWFWFQGSVQGAATTFVGNGGLLKKLEGWRAVLLDGGWPGRDLLASAGLSLLAVLVGWFIFRRLEDSFADVV